MMSKETVYPLQDFGKGHLWFHDHRKKLLSTYKNKWVAVQNQMVIDSDKDFEVLCSRLKDPGHTCVDYVTDEPLEMIL